MDVPRAHLPIGALGIKDRRPLYGSPLGVVSGPWVPRAGPRTGTGTGVGQGVDPAERLGMAEGSKGTSTEQAEE